MTIRQRRAIATANPFTVSETTVTGDGVFYGFVVTNTHATNAIAVTVYDNTSASGTVLAVLNVVALATANVLLPVGVAFSTGCYVAVTGTGTAVGTSFVEV